MKTLYLPFSRMQTWLRSSSKILLPAVLGLGLAQNADAQSTAFPRQVPFTTDAASGFTVGGSAKLTGTSTTEGVLQLTTNAQNTAGYAIDQSSFPAPSGFSISFEFFSYSGTGADGFSVFLIDADKTSAATFKSGATGGSLGYAQKYTGVNQATNSPGVPNGYIGIGIDEYGNFANPNEGRVGGRTTGPDILPDGRTPDAVSIRGAGLGLAANSTTDYPYIAGSGKLPFSLDVGTAGQVTDPTDPNYRRAYIDVTPQADGTYKIRVRLQNGTQLYTAIDNVTVSTPPPNLRIGFAGSTGGVTNFHEIRKLSILQSPLANDDVAGTVYNESVTLNAIGNDIFSYSNYKPGTVDLNPATAVIDDELVVTGKGTFRVTPDGQVTFTPLLTFAGVVTIPYTVQDIAGSASATPYSSNPANITIIVEGADVASSVSGPTSANPGARITYTVNTSNLGTLAATDVVPTLTLPTGLTNVVVSNGGSYNNGLVTFGTIASLEAGATPVTNTVTFTVPASGPFTSTATYKTPPTVPDPVASNNAATITTAVTGVANIASICATPGKDGPMALTSSTIPNTYYSIANNTTLAAGATSITLGAGTGNTAPIAAGDLVMIMQMQGIDINTTNSATYGATSTATGAYNAVGQYEYAVAISSVPLTGGNRTLTLAKGLTNGYQNKEYDATISGRRSFQVIRVPQYSSITVTGAVTGKAWDGSTGGVLALDVAGRTTFSNGASLNMNAKGFRGGGGKSYTGTGGATVQPTTATDGYRTLTTTAINASKGEGTAGTPRFVYNGTGTTTTDNTLEGYSNGANADGAPGNAGGGAYDYFNNNSGNAGGSGGSNGGNGGTGGYGFGSGTNGTGRRAAGARNVTGIATNAARLIMGGGGGAGSTNDAATNEYVGSGGIGGGIVILRTALVSGNGTIAANGGNAADAPNLARGAGGGGAGGTVLVLATPPTGQPNLSTLTITALGGNGGSAYNGNANTDRFGPGGGGGGGFVRTNVTYNNSGATPVNGGVNGSTDNNSDVDFGSSDGTAGTSTTNTTAASTLTIAGSSSCLPVLSMALATSTPNVVRPTGTAVNPATYTLTVSNTGGAATGVSALVTMDDLFGYDDTFTPVAVLTAADGTTSTVALGSLPANGISTPTFSGLSVPASASLRITFRATIATSAANNVAYQAGGLVSYANPLRTTATATVSPSGNYAGGTDTSLGTAGGNSYTATSSLAEDVIIARPLPVELKRFDVAAKGLNSELAWATASELQNDHFNIERSLDGKNFERINAVKGQGTSSKEVAYRYTDAGAGRLSLKPIYYRLQQVDLDGSSSYSPVRVVKFERGTKAAIALYPNPHQGTATLDLTALSSLDSQVEVMDISGRVVGKFQLLGGLEHPLDLNTLPLGSYLIRVRNAETVITLPMIRN